VAAPPTFMAVSMVVSTEPVILGFGGVHGRAGIYTVT
jgi:hypothetical protein